MTTATRKAEFNGHTVYVVRMETETYVETRQFRTKEEAKTFCDTKKS